MLSEKILKILQSHLGKGEKVLIWQIGKIYQLHVLYVLLFSNEMHHSHKLILSRAVQKVYFQLITRRSHLCTPLHPSQTPKLQFFRNNFEISSPRLYLHLRVNVCCSYFCANIFLSWRMYVSNTCCEKLCEGAHSRPQKRIAWPLKKYVSSAVWAKIWYVLHAHSFGKRYILQKKMW